MCWGPSPSLKTICGENAKRKGSPRPKRKGATRDAPPKSTPTRSKPRSMLATSLPKWRGASMSRARRSIGWRLRSIENVVGLVVFVEIVPCRLFLEYPHGHRDGGGKFFRAHLVGFFFQLNAVAAFQQPCGLQQRARGGRAGVGR